MNRYKLKPVFVILSLVLGLLATALTAMYFAHLNQLDEIRQNKNETHSSIYKDFRIFADAMRTAANNQTGEKDVGFATKATQIIAHDRQAIANLGVYLEKEIQQLQRQLATGEYAGVDIPADEFSAQSKPEYPRNQKAVIDLLGIIVTTLESNPVTPENADRWANSLDFLAPTVRWMENQKNQSIDQKLETELHSRFVLFGALLALFGSILLGTLILTHRNFHQTDEFASQLAEIHTTLSDMIDTISEAVALFDKNDILILCNQTFRDIFGLKRDPVGKSFPDLVETLSAQTTDKFSHEEKQNWLGKDLDRHNFKKTHEFQMADGRWILASDYSTRAGNRVRIRQDITDQKNAEQDLRDALDAARSAAKAKSEFLAIMSHEIRTPLNGVTGLLGLLLDTKLDPEQHGYVMTARESGELLLSVIEDILDYSKIEADKLVLEESEFSPDEIAQHVAELLAPCAHDKGIDIACFIDPSLPVSVRGDQARLRQILLNLAGNAVKFTNDGSVIIELALAASDAEMITLSGSVTDTGIGIPYDKQDSLFDEFNQLDVSYSRRFGGTGLGLSITRRLTEAMEGTISVNSEPDHGSTFSFTIQLKQTSNIPGAEKKSYEPVSKRTILFWEQQSATSHIIARQLRADGHQVISVKTENDALAQLREKNIDITIIDSRPGDKTGPILASRLHERGNQSPTLLLEPTGGQSQNSGVVQKGIVSAIHYKPVKLSELRDFVDHPHRATGDIISQPGQTWHMAGHGAGKRILLAEDSQTNRMVTATILRRAGYRVDWVTDGREAVESVKRLPYDLVLMDISMPNMDGQEATAIIRALPGDEREIPIIALTAHAMSGDKERFLASGMDAYLTKPLNAEILLTTLSEFLPAPDADNKNNKSEKDISANIDGQVAANFVNPQPQTDFLDIATIAQLKRDTGEAALKNLLEIFLGEMHERVNNILRFHRLGDIEAIGKEAHALKSSSGSFGALRLQILALELEETAKHREENKLPFLIENLKPIADQTREIFDKNFKVLPG